METNLSFSHDAIERVRAKLTWAQLELLVAPEDEFHLIIAGDDESVEELRAEISARELVIAQPQLGFAKELLPRRRWLQICLRLPEGWRGEIDADSVSGMIGAHKIIGEDVSLTTISGRVLAEGVSANTLSLHSVSGSIAGEALTARRANFRTISGRMGLTNLTLASAKASSVSGEIQISLNDGCRSLDLQSVSGSTSVEVDQVSGASAHSLSGQFVLSDEIQKTPDGVEITSTSVSGSLMIRRRKNNG